jgi:hypothetical protein
MEPEGRGMYKAYGPGVHRHIKYVLQQKKMTRCWMLRGLLRHSPICGIGLLRGRAEDGTIVLRLGMMALFL